MKFSQVLIALAVSISGTAFAADDHGHEAKPMHGGVTESRVCQLHSQSIARLRAKMRAH